MTVTTITAADILKGYLPNSTDSPEAAKRRAELQKIWNKNRLWVCAGIGAVAAIGALALGALYIGATLGFGALIFPVIATAGVPLFVQIAVSAIGWLGGAAAIGGLFSGLAGAMPANFSHPFALGASATVNSVHAAAAGFINWRVNRILKKESLTPKP